MKKRFSIRKLLVIGFLTLPAFAACYPILFLLAGSLMGRDELKANLSPVLSGGTGFIRCKNDAGDSRRAASCRGSGGLGICKIPFSGEKDFLYGLYYFDDDAVPGADALGISGA